MFNALIRIHHHLVSAVLPPVWRAGAITSTQAPHTPPEPMAPDWHIPAYLRRRVSGDALACPWPPRQH